MRHLFSEKYIILSTIALLLCSCSKVSNNNTTLIAKVYDKQLYLEDLEKNMPIDLNTDDSISWAKNFIDSWVRTELLLKEAENTLSPEELNVDRQLQEYRKSLLIYRYENSFNKLIDTTITKSDIEEAIPTSFHADVESHDSNLVKGVYLKFPWSHVDVNTVIKLGETENFEALMSYGKNFASEMKDYSNKWVDLPKLLESMPNNPNINKSFFSNKKYIDSSDANFYYFLCIRDLNEKSKNTSIFSPSLKEEDVRNTIMYKRKQEYLKQLESQMIEQAENSDNITIY